MLLKKVWQLYFVIITHNILPQWTPNTKELLQQIRIGPDNEYGFLTHWFLYIGLVIIKD